MRMSARVLEIDGQFLYIPGCMLVSFDDSTTHTTEVKLVRSAQGVDLGKLRDTHEIYKEVVHDLIGVEEATQRLDEVLKRGQKYNTWLVVVMYGFASACVGPFAFGARLIDLPIAFILGCLLGILQLIVAPKSELYSNIFEISAAVLTSFLARAFGSVRGGGLFCFSALAQSAIALILPGYTVREFALPSPPPEEAPLTRNLPSLRLPRAPIPQHRRRLRPHVLRRHLLPLPRLRHNSRHLHLRRSRPRRHLRSHLPQPPSPALHVPLRATVHPLPHHHQPRQMETDARHARHRLRRLHRQPLLRPPLRRQRPNRQHPRRPHHRRARQLLLPPAARPRGRGAAAGYLCAGAVRAGGRWELGQRRDERESDHESDDTGQWDAGAEQCDGDDDGQ